MKPNEESIDFNEGAWCSFRIKEFAWVQLNLLRPIKFGIVW